MNRVAARAMMSLLSPRAIERICQFRALRTFHLAAATVPAYRCLLQSLRVPVRRIWSINDFKQWVPVIDKASYLDQFPPEMLCRGGRVGGGQVIDGGGRPGASGFWVSDPAEERRFARDLEHLFRDLFEAHRVRTLTAFAHSPGAAPASEVLARAVCSLASAGRLALTVVSPGTTTDAVQDVLEAFLDRFPQALLVGAPVFVKELIDNGARRGIRWADRRVHVLAAAERFCESWKVELTAALGCGRTGGRGSGRIVACYCPSGGGIVAAAETPFTLRLTQLAAQDPVLCRDLFGSTAVPCVFQYNPGHVWAEDVEGKLVLTCRGAMPLVRYSVGAVGGDLSCERALEAVSGRGYDTRRFLRSLGWPAVARYPLPMFYVRGRPNRPSAALAADADVGLNRRADAVPELG